MDKTHEVPVPRAIGRAPKTASPGSGAGSHRGEALSRVLSALPGAPGRVHGVLESAPSPTPLIYKQKRDHLRFVFFLLIRRASSFWAPVTSNPTASLERPAGRWGVRQMSTELHKAHGQGLPGPVPRFTSGGAEQARSSSKLCREACFCVFIFAGRSVY